MKAKLPSEDITFHKDAFSAYPDLTDPEADALCTFIESPIGEAEMSRFPALKLIATRSTGFDHIDLAAAKTRGIAVANVPFYGENTVAEFAFALLLALSRRIIDADERVRAGTFSPTGLRGFDLAGKTIGIVGTGHIGAHVIKMAQGFGMKIIGFDAYPNQDLSHTLNFPYVSLPELLAQSDIISLHVPYNPHTHHLINKENIGSIKRVPTLSTPRAVRSSRPMRLLMRSKETFSRVPRSMYLKTSNTCKNSLQFLKKITTSSTIHASSSPPPRLQHPRGRRTHLEHHHRKYPALRRRRPDQYRFRKVKGPSCQLGPQVLQVFIIRQPFA